MGGGASQMGGMTQQRPMGGTGKGGAGYGQPNMAPYGQAEGVRPGQHPMPSYGQPQMPSYGQPGKGGAGSGQPQMSPYGQSGKGGAGYGQSMQQMIPQLMQSGIFANKGGAGAGRQDPYGRQPQMRPPQLQRAMQEYQGSRGLDPRQAQEAQSRQMAMLDAQQRQMRSPQLQREMPEYQMSIGLDPRQPQEAQQRQMAMQEYQQRGQVQQQTGMDGGEQRAQMFNLANAQGRSNQPLQQAMTGRLQQAQQADQQVNMDRAALNQQRAALDQQAAARQQPQLTTAEAGLDLTGRKYI